MARKHTDVSALAAQLASITQALAAAGVVTAQAPKTSKAAERKAQKVEDYLARLSSPTVNPDGTVTVSFARADGKVEPIALSPFVSACITLARKSLK